MDVPTDVVVAKPTITYDDFMKVDLRVATVVSARADEKSDRLMILEVDLGVDGKRQIVAGIKQHYTAEQLLGKQVIICANLEPRKVRGHESTGMVLAAFDETGGKLSVLTVDRPSPAGLTVS